MKNRAKYFIILFFATAFLFFPENDAKAACALVGPGLWGKNPPIVVLNESITYSLSGNQECANKNVIVEVYGKEGVDFRINTMAVRANSSGSVVATMSFKEADFSGRSGDQTVYLKAKAEDGSSNQVTSSNLTVKSPNSTNTSNTGVSIAFDIDPRVIPRSNVTTAVANVSIDLVKYGSYCGNNNVTSFKFYVMWDYSSGFDLTQFSKTFNFSRTGATASVPIRESFTAKIGSGNQKLYGLVECPNGTNVTESGRVDVSGGTGLGESIYSCTGPDSTGKNVYICSSNNQSNCGDTSGCADKTKCNQIRLSLCGQPVSSTEGEARCGNNICEPGETIDTCRGDCSGGGCGTPGKPCVPGASQSFSFSIPNPLKGGADDFSELVKIIAQWIFNLAIPIAVAMIVYSGILFLTAAGDTAKVTKARDVLKYAVIGLAIILIGSGFISLIRSILELGSPTP